MSRRSRFLAVLAVGALTLSGCGFSGLYNAPLPGGADLGDHPYSLTVYFQDVLDLVPQSAVRVNDAPVGKVTDINLAECPNPSGTDLPKIWCAKVKIEVNGEVKLPTNSTAAVDQTSLLGEKYVDLIRPSNSSSNIPLLHNGDQIPLLVAKTGTSCPSIGSTDIKDIDVSSNVCRNTSSAPEAEDVLGALSLLLNGGGLNQIQIIAHELNNALDTKQRQSATRDLLTQLASFTGTLDGQKNQIIAALQNVNNLAITLNQQKQTLDESLDTFPAALKILSDQRSRLVKLLSSLSNFGAVATRVINASQSDLVAGLKSLNPVVTKLAETGSNLPKALRIAGTFPFPLGLTRQIIKGDYANLDAYVQIDLGDLLCQSGNATLCTVAKTLTNSQRDTKVSVKTGSVKRLTPSLIGSRS